MIRTTFLLFLLSGFTICLSQDPDPAIDSLKQVISQQKNDSIKVNSLIDLGNLFYANGDADQALKYGTEALKLAENINFQMGIGYAYKLLGFSYASQADYQEATVQLQESLKVFESIDFKDGIANLNDNLGSIHFNAGQDAKAIEYHLKALKIAEEIDNKIRVATALNNLGTVYANKEATYDMAITYFLRALPLFMELSYSPGIGHSSMNLGEIYFKKGEYSSSSNYLQTAIEIYSGTTDVCFPLSYMGAIYAEQGNFSEALEFHNKAIQIAETFNSPFELAQSLIALANSLEKKGDIKLSIDSYLKAKEISEGIGAKQEVKKVYEALASLYAKIEDYKFAYTYETLLTQIKDTLYNTDEDKKIQQLQFNFDINKKEAEIGLQQEIIQRQKIANYASAIAGFLFLLVAIGSFNRYKYVKRTNKIIKNERDRSQELLLNILPEETAKELEVDGHAKTRYYENVTVLFTDFKGFSTIAGKLTPIQLVAQLNDYFMAFDEIMGKHNLEKIKTIGDAYMCAGGIPITNNSHPLDAVKAALDMQAYMNKRQRELESTGLEAWELRIGIHTGPVVAGVVGKRKYAYDIWGDTVNVASRMESNGAPGKVNISSATFNLIKEKYECTHRGKISAKNIGEVDMYFIEREIIPHPVEAD